ncbi:hypothetical protein HanIR_Chr09g0438081 [Helianthus annuus]|nr:hypothetical protein HanIR_Chr09g0438081 [Helianthus annuus]
MLLKVGILPLNLWYGLLAGLIFAAGVVGGRLAADVVVGGRATVGIVAGGGRAVMGGSATLFTTIVWSGLIVTLISFWVLMTEYILSGISRLSWYLWIVIISSNVILNKVVIVSSKKTTLASSISAVVIALTQYLCIAYYL